ncbi:MAG: zinc ribbon domain-containing protein [Pseudomonadota bacterium]
MVRRRIWTGRSTSRPRPTFEICLHGSASGPCISLSDGERMPIYDYKCSACGVFQAVAPLTQFADPTTCPSCGATSPRALTVPRVSTVSSTARKAHAINERSADSPKRAKANGLRPSGPKINSKARTYADGSKSIPNARPWMLSH